MKRSSDVRRALALLALATLPLPAAMAADTPADTDTATEMGEVVVTATRREQNINDVPFSTTALSGDPLQVLGDAGDDIKQLAFKVPSLNIESSNGRAFPRF